MCIPQTREFKYRFCTAGSNVHAQTGTGDTALTYACENGHTDVAEVLLAHGAELVSFNYYSLEVLWYRDYHGIPLE